MQKTVVFLIVVGSLIGVGFVLSFLGAQLTTKDLTVLEGNLISGESMEVQTELDPSISQTGVFVVQIVDFEDGAISATIFDPSGIQIVSKSIRKESFEDKFEISSSGTYRLLIENSGQDEAQILGVLGHMPDTSMLSVGITGFYIVIIGLIGIVGVGIYAVKNRRKEKLS